MIAFTVSYTLKEYLSFVQAHAAKEAAQARLAWPVRLLIGIVGTVMFAIKKHRMPVCHFAIDEEGIVRTTGEKKLVLPWRDVTAIHRYQPGYLVAEARGAMPLPFRSLTPQQAALLDSLVRRRENELAAPA
ncbi:YcxB family protein [Pseudoduganella sp.]|uniref:YcxB family protein n=1 Tax=Pseudoduganella sp. TaxID=1880898 RepID=UPI0035B49A6F